MEPLYNDGKIEDFFDVHYGDVLGNGTSGITYRCIQIASGLQFACKCIPKHKVGYFEDDVVKTTLKEIEVMYYVRRHPNTITIERVFEDATKIYIVMELCTGGDLFDCIIQQGFLLESKTKTLMQTIIGVVEACHELGVVHLDLKPSNILLQTSKEDSTLKCIDFGASQFFTPGQVFRKIVGTPSYIAPEVWKRNYGEKSDIWSCGVIMYNMLSGTFPFSNEVEPGGIPSEVMNEEPPTFEDDQWRNVSENAKDLIRRMLSYDTKKRPTASEVLKHPWMLESIHTTAPKRMSCTPLFRHYKVALRIKKLLKKKH